MVISHLNRFFEKHGTAALVVIGLIIIIPFVFFTGKGSLGKNRGRGARKLCDVGEMYGKKINKKKFHKHLQKEKLMLQLDSIMKDPTSYRGGKSNDLVGLTLLRMRALRAAHEMGIDKVSEQEVVDKIQAMSIFQNGDGVFDADMLGNFRKNMLVRQLQMDGEDFDEMVKENIIIERLCKNVSKGVEKKVTVEGIRKEYNRFHETVKLRYAEYKTADFIKEIKLFNDEQIKKYYSEHKDDLVLAAKKVIKYVSFGTTASYRNKVIQDPAFKVELTKLNKKIPNITKVQKSENYRSLVDQKRKKMEMDDIQSFQSQVIEMRKVSKKSAAEIFVEVAKKCELKVITLKPFNLEDYKGISIPPIHLKSLYSLSTKNPFTKNSLLFDGCLHLAVLEKVLEPEHPTSYEQVKNKIVFALRDKLLKDYYDKNIAIYKDKVQKDLLIKEVTDKMKKIRENDKLSEKEKQAKLEAIYRPLQKNMEPFFIPIEKKVKFVTFEPHKFENQVVVTIDEMREYYKENKKSKYETTEYRVRELIIDIPKKATPEDIKKLQKKAEDLLAQVKTNSNKFIELVKKYSSDKAVPTTRGLTGKMSRMESITKFDRSVPELKVGEFSKVIKKANQFIIVKMIEKPVTITPFDSVSRTIKRVLALEMMKEKADAKAGSFIDQVYDLVESKKIGFSKAFDILAKKYNLTVNTTNWFSTKNTELQRVFPRTFNSWEDYQRFSKQDQELYALTDKKSKGEKEVNQISNVLEYGNKYYVACAVEERPADIMPYSQKARSMIESIIKEDKALAKAVASAKADLRLLKAKLVAGADLDTASKDMKVADKTLSFASEVDFKAVELGNRNSKTASIPEVYKIFPFIQPDEKSKEKPVLAKHFLPVIEGQKEALLVYVVSRTLPTDKEFEKDKKRLMELKLNSLKTEKFLEYMSQLEKESNTELTPAWGSKK